LQRLKDWTGRQWIVSVNAQGAGRETLRDVRTAEALAHPLVKKALEIFPGAEIVAIRDPRPEGGPAEEPAAAEEEGEQ
jgi:DNA polymerase-3 subunit gamma/tau